MMERRRALMMAGKKARLPTEYQEVEWIGINASQNSQLLDTNVVPKTAIRFVTKYYFKQSGWRSFFGSDVFRYIENSNNANCDYSYGSYSTSTAVVSSAPYTWHDLDAGPSLVQDGILRIPESSTAGKYNFSDNTVSFKIGGGPNAKAWRVKRRFVYDGDVLMADLVPCYRKTDSRIGMYDVMQDSFRIFPSTKNNVKGADVT